jgi:DNA-directed RNA polymerase sigma subunit (sigma70/sigma32)
MKNSLIISGVKVDIPTAIKKYKAVGKSTIMTERQRTVFESRFGIKDGIVKRDTDTAQIFGISTVRVRQLYASVLYKIGVLPEHYWSLDVIHSKT